VDLFMPEWLSAAIRKAPMVQKDYKDLSYQTNLFSAGMIYF